ncbi:MAG: PaaI family thioesterase [Methylocystaceae bacterium]|nr:PaaI family thioesterase [Methylocystaceae bacterium]
MTTSLKKLQDFNELIAYADLVGLHIEEDDQGIITRLAAQQDNIGNEIIGAIHGGVVGGLLEHAASFHLLYELEDLKVTSRIINLSIDYLRPALLKDTFARAHVYKQGKRVVNVRIQAWQDDENRPVACGHAHFLIA